MKHTPVFFSITAAALIAWLASERASLGAGGSHSARVALPVRALTPSVRAGSASAPSGRDAAPTPAAPSAEPQRRAQSTAPQGAQLEQLKQDYIRARDRVRLLTERRAEQLLHGAEAGAEADYREILALTAQREALVSRLRELAGQRARSAPNAAYASPDAAGPAPAERSIGTETPRL